MRKILTILILTALLLGQWPHAADATSAGSFTMRPVGARSLGMGSAVVAMAEDGSMGYWNPAGLAFINRSEFNSMQGTILGDVDYLYLGYNRLRDPELWDTALGFNLLNTRVDGIKEATYQNGSGVLTGKTFSYQGNAYVLSVAKALERRLAVGFNLKYIQEILYENSASGFGLDAGLLYRLNSNTNFGLVYQNIKPAQLTWDTHEGTIETMPFNIIIGVAHKINKQFKIALDINSRSDRGFGAQLGGEFMLNQYFTFRAGYSQDRLWLGTSIYYNKFGVHYSFATEPVGEVVDNKHFLSISYVLEEKEDLIEPVEEEISEPMAIPTKASQITEPIEEIPLIEFKKEVAINKMVVKKLNGTIQTEVVFENIGEVTADVKATLTIYDKDKRLLKLFPVKRINISTGEIQTMKFDWHRETVLPYGEYFFKVRILYNSHDKSIIKKVVRKKSN
ncbi:MAG: PorV/PorQ family protein [Candidatus Margulisbacteria bacterium]|nr:PorV/PorQ family protein [Candidatus Margulisiibacteriota bacterium]